MSYDFDLFVIGGGSGGVRAARTSAAMGATVGLAEARQLGGTCVNLGCVPKKMFMYAAQYSSDFQMARDFGWQIKAEPKFDFKTLLKNKNKEIERLNQVYETILAKANVEIFAGRAQIKSHQEVVLVDEVGVEQTITCKNILIATGSRADKPDIIGADLALVSDQMFHLAELPKSMVIVGGGYIALEFASIMHGFGTDTTLMYRGDLFLRGFDLELRHFIKQCLSDRGINLIFNDNIENIEAKDPALRVTTSEGSKLEADQVLFATGRVANSSQFRLDELGIKHENGFIQVDQNYQTSVDSIYALGDVIGSGGLTPIALAEAMVFSRNLFANKNERLDYDNIPTAVFCLPNVATVGLSEEKARRELGDITIYKSSYRELKKTLTGSIEKTFLKLVVETKTDKVVGAHMVGTEAGEVIQGIAIAIRNGLTKSQFDLTIGIHPTNAEEFVTMRSPS